tara:strand:- start:520 stop:1377 length:858 start_codon:yes stop_codon:yes gene_type:complete
MNLELFIKSKIDEQFLFFLEELIDLYCIHEISSNIYKSKFISIKILVILYNKIIKLNNRNINLLLNNLFIKIIQYNLGKQIPEKDITNYLDSINMNNYKNHICPYNYHNYWQSTCEYSIFKSFANCLYHYINDIHISYNSNISDEFAKQYLSPENYIKFKENLITINDNVQYLNETINEHDYNKNIDIIYKQLQEETNNKLKTLLSINNNLLWKDILNVHDKNYIDINYLFLNNFEKQIKQIRNESILYWQAKCKIENWLLKCYWSPHSSFRKKKLCLQFYELSN